jgi:hypothetical protein
MLIYLVNPSADYPKNATLASIPTLANGKLGPLNVPAGTYKATWYDPATAVLMGQTPGVAHLGGMVLPLPTFSEDLMGRIVRVT